MRSLQLSSFPMTGKRRTECHCTSGGCKDVLQQKETEERAGKLFLLVLEAALLIEEHYDEICDELWYIYTTEENRRARLKASEGIPMSMWKPDVRQPAE